MLVDVLAGLKSYLTGGAFLENDKLSDGWSARQSHSTCKSELTEKLPFATDAGKHLYYQSYSPDYARDLSRRVCL